jgi:hypothetical protein
MSWNSYSQLTRATKHTLYVALVGLTDLKVYLYVAQNI